MATEKQTSVSQHNSTPPEQKAAGPGEEAGTWAHYDKNDLPDLERRINPSEYVLWKCNYDRLMQSFGPAEVNVELPTGEGLMDFHLTASGTMNSALAEKFPDIRSYKGTSDDGTISARVDTNTEGLFAEFRSDEGKFLLAPLLKGSKTYYALFQESALPGSPRDETYK